MTSPSLGRLKRVLGLSSTGGTWRLLAIIFALLNLKSWPFMWHIRLLTTLIRHIILSPPPVPPRNSHLFAPIISSSRSPLLESDYNLHKSNSTYFSDLDIGRSHLVTALCARGIGLVHAEERAHGGGMVKVMLGGVGCAFRREIGIYQAYDIWTRVLAWDRKWLYLVSHFVEKGAVRPSAYLLQPGVAKRGPAAGTTALHSLSQAATAPPDPHPAIFASSIAKYVFKKGRRTIPPARILRASALLPAEPASTSPASIPPDSSSTTATTAEPNETGLSAPGPAVEAVEAVQSLLDASLTAEMGGKGKGGEWTWEEVERERVRGMKVAGLMAELDEGLVGEFRAEGEEGGEVLGRYWG